MNVHVSYLLLQQLCWHPVLLSLVQVSTLKMHLFTLIQLVCVGILWVVKISPFSLALPFVIILTVPLRMLITGTLFSVREMKCVSTYSMSASLIHRKYNCIHVCVVCDVFFTVNNLMFLCRSWMLKMLKWRSTTKLRKMYMKLHFHKQNHGKN